MIRSGLRALVAGSVPPQRRWQRQKVRIAAMRLRYWSLASIELRFAPPWATIREWGRRCGSPARENRASSWFSRIDTGDHRGSRTRVALGGEKFGDMETLKKLWRHRVGRPAAGAILGALFGLLFYATVGCRLGGG